MNLLISVPFSRDENMSYVNQKRNWLASGKPEPSKFQRNFLRQLVTKNICSKEASDRDKSEHYFLKTKKKKETTNLNKAGNH